MSVPVLWDGIQAVFVGIDDAARANAALPIALGIAEAAKAVLRMVAVADVDLGEDLIREMALSRRPMVLEPQRDLAPALTELTNEYPASIIVMAVGTEVRLGLGAVQEEVLRVANAPILLVGPGTSHVAPWRPGRFLFPQDGTFSSTEALGGLLRWADSVGQETFILYISRPERESWPEQRKTRIPQYMDQPQHEWPSWLSSYLERVRRMSTRHRQTPLYFHWTLGEPTDQVLSFADRERIDLIVLPSRGGLGLRRPVAVRRIAREAPCPLLVLPAMA